MRVKSRNGLPLSAAFPYGKDHFELSRAEVRLAYASVRLVKVGLGLTVVGAGLTSATTLP